MIIWWFDDYHMYAHSHGTGRSIFFPLYSTLKQHNQTRFFAMDHAKRTKTNP